ncbi:MAG TPA: acylphosphatase, partial [Polyangiaceae bacterium]|nr:acylphosphatase [Polyangiaceae bacterium]
MQGVGFRPFVYRLAEELCLGGFVMNHAGEVQIEAEGPNQVLDTFSQRLRSDAPPLATIATFQSSALVASGERRFRILPSQTAEVARPFITPDVATCEQCLAELFDESDRRFRYPFLNCTDCGPRLTIVESAPYDRERTTMRSFAMCAKCRGEYQDPRSRRFHAQPNACPSCGPILTFAKGSSEVHGEDALGAAVAALRAGGVIAIKGIGGFHLACDAANGTAL